VPKETERLFDLLRLRRVAKSIGFEKIILKYQKLVCYFISNQDSPYYQSSRFQAVLEFIKHNPRLGEMKEKNGKLLMSFSGVNEIYQATQILEQMQVAHEKVLKS
jgi:transcription-repair coupling factor (superfamily II helicase)